jgi:hypothetical protein
MGNKQSRSPAPSRSGANTGKATPNATGGGAGNSAKQGQVGAVAAIPAQVRTAGVLYWARGIDEAGLLPFIEKLSEGVVTGRLLLPLSPRVTRRFVTLFRNRRNNYTEAERRALYKQLRSAVEAPLRRLSVVAASAKTPDDPRLLQAAKAVAEAASKVAVGITNFATRNILQQIREGLDLLRDQDVLNAFGAKNPVELVSKHAPMVLGRPVDVQGGVTGAEAGQKLFSALADQVPLMKSGNFDPKEIVRYAPAVKF